MEHSQHQTPARDKCLFVTSSYNALTKAVFDSVTISVREFSIYIEHPLGMVCICTTCVLVQGHCISFLIYL